MSTRAYPLDLQEIADTSEDFVGVFSKGHHGDAFVEVALKHLRERQGFSATELEEITEHVEALVFYETWRCVPTRLSDGEWWVMFRPAKPGHPGAFPVTVLRVDE